MRTRWMARKRAQDDASETLDEVSDKAVNDEALEVLPENSEALEILESGDEHPLDFSGEGQGSGFMEPTPKVRAKDSGKRIRLEIEDLDAEPSHAPVDSDSTSSSASFNKNTFQLNSFAATDFRMFKQPWEKGRMNKLFGKQFDFGRTVPSVDTGGAHGWSLTLGWSQQSMESTTIKEVVDEPSAAIFKSVVKTAPEFDYFEEREWKRRSAVSLWWSLVNCSLSDSAAGSQVVAEATLESIDDYGKELIDATFGLKSPSTLLKRYYSLKAYADWCEDVANVRWLPFVEADVWSYMRWLKATDAPPTKATSLVEAIRFGWYVVGFAGAGEVQSSLRLKGMASQMFVKKKPWRPAALLEVKEIVKIHKFLEDESKELVDRVFAGHLLHLLYVRGRWSDLSAVQNGEVDKDDKFFELSTQHHKGAKGQEAKSRLLPLVAPCHGITGVNWCKIYLQVREKAGLQLPSNVPLAMLLAPAKGCAMDWTSRALTSQEGTAFMRKLLGVPADSERRVSTHSLKSTAISWCSKYGLGLESRALLSRHISAVSNPTALYSRDLLSAVMREFCQVIDLIAKARFEPDRTRSGMLTPVPSQAPGTPVGPTSASRLIQGLLEADRVGLDGKEDSETAAVDASWCMIEASEERAELPDGLVTNPENVPGQKQSEQIELSESSESDPSVTESSDEQEEEQVKVHEAIDKPPKPTSGDFYINNKSLVIHLVVRPGFFRCGRKLGWLYTKVPELHGIRCTKCFNL